MVWKARARFIHKKFLVNYPDHEQDGIFEADPSLNKFLATSQASIAGLKLQWAFEAEHNLEECYQIIEDYCNGGDGYLTEDVMRSACGLPVRQRNLQADEGVGNLINADVESDAEKDDKTKCWHTLRESMVTYLLSKDTESITYYEFKKMPLQADTHPNVSRSVMWDELENHHVVRKSLAEGKTSKEKPGRFFPDAAIRQGLYYRMSFIQIRYDSTAIRGGARHWARQKICVQMQRPCHERREPEDLLC